MEKRQSVRASGNLLKTKQNEITEQKQVNKKKKKKKETKESRFINMTPVGHICQMRFLLNTFFSSKKYMVSSLD